MAKDNTMLYIGVGVVALLFLMKQNTPSIPVQQIAPGEPTPSPAQIQLAEDIANGNVVLDIQDVPVISNGLDPALVTECLSYRTLGIPGFVYGNKCEPVFNVYG